MEINDRIKDLIAGNEVMVFMKGTRSFPQCGFSARVVDILNRAGATYETVDVLSDAEIRQGIKDYSNWPTIPQVYIRGEFIGGSDILMDLYQSGDLQTKLATPA